MTDDVMKKEDDSIQYFLPKTSRISSISSSSSSNGRRRRFAEWLPWKLFQDQMNPDKANHGWFIGRYARECLHILPNLPTCIKWPFHQPSVLEWHQVDESLREPGIYYGYRPEVSSWMECCHSLFTANNETLNFWTHFFPTVFFIWRTVQLASQWNKDDDLHHSEYAHSFIAYMMTAILYPFMSAVAHGFSALSHRARAVLFFMDYAAINFYAYGSALLYRSYVLPDTWMENETGTNIYLTVCFILSLASTALTCTSRAFVRDVVAQRLMRLAAFTLPYIWVSIPLFARLVNCFACADESSSCPTAETLRAAKYHLCQVIVALLASFCYASHLPERVMPGMFDYVGHSHNLLHICGVTATLFQMEGALLDMEVRRPFLTQNHLAMIDHYWSVWSPVILLAGHVLLVGGFGLYIYWNEAATVECQKNKMKCH